MDEYADALARYSRRQGKEGVRRYSHGDFDTWTRTLREHPDRAPIFADWLEENESHHPHAPGTLETLRTETRPLHVGTVNGVAHAIPRLPVGLGGRVSHSMLDPLTRAYATAAMETSYNHGTDDEYESPLFAETHELSDLHPDTLNHLSLLTHAFRTGLPPHLRELVDDDPDNAGFDLWLTSNHHGSGFWDVRWDHNGEGVGDELTEHAHRLPDVHLYAGDDGMVHHA